MIKFAQNNTAFMEAFGVAFQKLSENGYGTDLLMTAETDVAPDSAENIHAIIFITVSLMIMSIIAVWAVINYYYNGKQLFNNN